MECAAFVGEVKTRVINNNLEDITLHNSDLLVKETEECRLMKEENIEANELGNLAERIELDGKLSQLKISIDSCNMHYSQCLEYSSMHTATTEASTCVSNAEDITSEKSVYSDYDTMVDDNSVIDETLIVGTIYYKSKKNSVTADHLSKIWKIAQEDAHLTINNTTQMWVTQADPSMKMNYSANNRMAWHKMLDEYFHMDVFML